MCKGCYQDLFERKKKRIDVSQGLYRFGSSYPLIKFLHEYGSILFCVSSWEVTGSEAEKAFHPILKAPWDKTFCDKI